VQDGKLGPRRSLAHPQPVAGELFGVIIHVGLTPLSARQVIQGPRSGGDPP
jgi:hypothetical protein